MSLNGFVESRGWLIACTDEGKVMGWPIANHLINKFPNGVSLVRSTVSEQLSQSPLLSLHCSHNNLLTYSSTAVYISSNIESKWSKIDLTKLIEAKNEITCLQSIDEENLLIGTAKGILYLYDWKEGNAVYSININTNVTMQEQSQEFENQAITHSITSILPYGQASSALISSSNGKIFIVQIPSLQIRTHLDVPSAVQSNKPQNISLVAVDDDPYRFYSIHEQHILEWSIKFSQCMSYIPIKGATSILKAGEDLIIGSMSSKLILFSQEKQNVFDSSMRRVNAIRKITTKLWAAAGTDGLIDIFSGSTRIMTLFTAK